MWLTVFLSGYWISGFRGVLIRSLIHMLAALHLLVDLQGKLAFFHLIHLVSFWLLLPPSLFESKMWHCLYEAIIQHSSFSVMDYLVIVALFQRHRVLLLQSIFSLAL